MADQIITSTSVKAPPARPEGAPDFTLIRDRGFDPAFAAVILAQELQPIWWRTEESVIINGLKFVIHGRPRGDRPVFVPESIAAVLQNTIDQENAVADAQERAQRTLNPASLNEIPTYIP